MFSDADGQPLVVYTDGCCLNNGYSGAQGGIGVWWGSEGEAEDGELAERLPGHPQTNNRAELWAIIRAIETCPYPGMRLEIRTDSKYAIGCASVWIHKWRGNGFTNCKGYDVANKDLIVRLSDALLDRRARVTFVHVEGHGDDDGNDAADTLARDAANGCYDSDSDYYDSDSYYYYSDSESDY